MELRDIDLNLLLVFDRMLTEKRVSAVAEGLGLSQPAISNALARLRKLLGDDLFLRTAHGMAPTPFALQLAEPVALAMGTLHGALNRPTSFDPASSTRSFTLATTDVGEVSFVPILMEALLETAPGVSINMVRNSANHLRETMEAGEVDLAVGLLPQLKAGIFQRLLLRERYVCVFSTKLALAAKPTLTLKDFCAAEHLLVKSAGTGHGHVDELMAARAIKRRIRLTVPHYLTLGHILSATPLIATVPERLALRIAEPFDLAWRPHPVELPQININMFWHTRYHRDPGNRWLRDLLFERFADA
jgi:DNA-binding transcriptional LysR family regulator